MSILMADRISAGAYLGLYHNEPEEYSAKKRALVTLINGATKIIANECAEMVTHKLSRSNGLDLMSDFPNLRLPFSQCFIEYEMQGKKTGILLVEYGNDRVSELKEDMQNKIRSKVGGIDGDEWNVIAMFLFTPFGDGGFLTSSLCLAIIRVSGDPIYFHVTDEATETAKLLLIQSDEIMVKAMPALFAVSLMNCKNIKLQQQEPNPKLSKSFQKRHGKPLSRHYTLEIEPMKKVLQTEGDIEHNGLKKALHLCRGHFAHYTPEKGFLGRPLSEPLTIWKPAHVRGSASEGIVTKDYKVKAPKEN